MCDGALPSMLPALTIDQFGITRGPEVYSVMYSSFGVASMLGLVFVLTVKDIIGFEGMFVISAIFETTAVIMVYKLNEQKPYNYKDAKIKSIN